MKRVIKKVLKILLIVMILFVTSSWILKGIYFTVFQSSKDIIFVNPIIGHLKYYVLAACIFFIIKRYYTLTSWGKKIIPILIILSFAGILFVSLFFTAVDEEKVVKQRFFYRSTKTWDEVSYVSTDVHQEKLVMTKNTMHKPRPYIIDYTIHFKDGGSVNAWKNIPAVYELHEFVTKNDIEVNHLMDDDYFYENVNHQYKDELDNKKLKFILGVDSEK